MRPGAPHPTLRPLAALFAAAPLVASLIAALSRRHDLRMAAMAAAALALGALSRPAAR